MTAARVFRWADIAAVASELRAGALAVLPTDTVPGFSCLVTAAAAFDRVRALKQAGTERAFVVLAASAEQIAPWLDASQDARAWRFLATVWPAPLTAVVATKPGLPGALAAGMGSTLAVRVPAHEPLRALLAMLDAPLVSTSVNAHGGEPLRRPDSILDEFGTRIDLLVRDDAPGDASPASTLANCTRWPPQVLRRGAFDLESALARHGEPA